MAESDGRTGLSTVLLFVGAAAGLAVFLSLIGALVSWGRFYALELPSDAASSTLSQSTLLVRGVNALAAPFFAGAVAAGLSVLLRRSISRRHSTAQATRRLYITVGLASVVLLTLLAGLLDFPRVALNVALGGLLVVGSLTFAFQAVRTTVVVYTILGSIVGLGMFLLIWGIFRLPTDLERAEVTFSDGRVPVNGFWIAGTPDTAYVAPQVRGKDGPCQATGEILAFPREDVVRVRFEPAVEVWPQDRTPDPDSCR